MPVPTRLKDIVVRFNYHNYEPHLVFLHLNIVITVP